MNLVAAIDQGTTSTKALLVRPDGSASVIGAIKHRQIMERPGYVEHDGAELLRNVSALIEQGAAAGAESIALTNQGETVIAWDKESGTPICNAIVWQDQRTAPEIDALREAGLEMEVRRLAGLPLDAYFSASKLKWILDNVAEARPLLRAGRLGLGTSDAYFMHRLTGRYVTDVTTAARTSLMNLDRCVWDERLCEVFGVPIEALPGIVECDAPVGAIGRAELRVAIVDQVAALYGHGCRAAGDTKVTFGTGAFALTISDGRPTTPGTVHTVCWGGPDHRAYAADGGVYTAGAAIEWLMRIGMLSSVDDLDSLSGEPAVAGNLCFVPALSGLACPHWDRSAAGLWIGLDGATSREDMIKAVLEGIAFRTVEVLETLGGRSNHAMLSIDGGLVRSRYFTRFLAAAANRSVAVPANNELTAYGAALLANPDIVALNLQRETIEPARAGDMDEWRQRFSAARTRSSGWRRL